MKINEKEQQSTTSGMINASPSGQAMAPPAFQLKTEGEEEHTHDEGHEHDRPAYERGGGSGGGRKKSNARFDQDEDIKKAIKKKDFIEEGDTGMSVTILQQGLVDAKYDLPGGVTGVFDANTTTVVKKFQKDQKIKQDGVVGPKTMKKLTALHNKHETIVDIAENVDPLDPMDGTRAISPDEKTAFKDALDTSPKDSSGKTPDFKKPKLYEKRVRKQMLGIITRFNKKAQKMKKKHADSSKLHDWNDIHAVADASKRETDRVFGGYYDASAKPAFRHGVNLHDAWEQENDAINNDPGYDDYILKDLAGYLLNNYIQKINKKHGADPGRATEKALLLMIRNDFMASHRAELLDIQRSWPGLADGGQVAIQVIKSDKKKGNRSFMWDMFGTIIHEYIHTLEHANHVKFRDPMDESKGGLTLREGMCDYFTRMVWKSVNFDDKLRGEVEGPFNDPKKKHKIPATSGYYDSIEQAERAVGIVGVRNVMAAFFMGKTDLIGA